MKHYLTDAQIVRDRMRNLRHNADQYRLAQMSQVYRPSLSQRLLAGLGNWMIVGGTRLLARYEGVASYQLPVTTYQTPAGMKAE
jgi:hypothetical protein